MHRQEHFRIMNAVRLPREGPPPPPPPREPEDEDTPIKTSGCRGAPEFEMEGASQVGGASAAIITETN